MCQSCGTKWFIPGQRVTEPDLTECAGCGGPLEMFAGPRAGADGELPPPEDEAQGGGWI